MTLPKTAVYMLAATLAGLSLRAQPPSRWTLSFNPFGLVEPPAAIGLGVGYRFSRRVELWSETSFLTNGLFQTEGPLAGIRQILQTKYFIYKDGSFFVAAEVRYKNFQYRDKEDFYNPATHDSLRSFSNFSRHYFFGAGLQVGGREPLTRDGKLQVELVAGLGVRKVYIEREDVPQGYEYRNFHASKDVNAIENARNPGPMYFPGSIRLIYLFGKRFRS
ncbi:MAG: hypothetical protein J0H74_23290 [Chitinophagaceae bacterium]|nr:hypothetical protein [Chitinophagaceae bacterium]